MPNTSLRRLADLLLLFAFISFILAFIYVVPITSITSNLSTFSSSTSSLSSPYTTLISKFSSSSSPSPSSSIPTSSTTINLQNRTRPINAISDTNTKCQHTYATSHLSVDSHGRLCSHQLLLSTSSHCCPPSSSSSSSQSSEQYTCSNPMCNRSAKCCASHEHCVSCCLAPSNDHDRMSLRLQSAFKLYSMETEFDVCEAACRSRSVSVTHENAYRSDFHHCFGPHGPKIDDALHHGVFDFASPVSVENQRFTTKDDERRRRSS